MYLGPLVAAQQVLDPSPQTRHPRKEKRGGGGGGTPPLQSSLNPVSRYKHTLSGCLGKVFYLLLMLINAMYKYYVFN